LRRCLRQRSLSVLRSLIIARRSARKKRFLQRSSTDFTGRTSVPRLRRPRKTDVTLSALPCISTSTETGWQGSQETWASGKNLQRNMHVICEQCGNSVDVDFLARADRSKECRIPMRTDQSNSPIREKRMGRHGFRASSSLMCAGGFIGGPIKLIRPFARQNTAASLSRHLTVCGACLESPADSFAPRREKLYHPC
jgi:hypothetical protein